MPIEGPARDLSLSDLLQLLFLSRRTGRLVFRDATRPEVTLHLSEGLLVGASAVGPEMRLGRLLVGAGRVTEAQLEAALAHQARDPARPIGEHLVDLGMVRADEVERQLQFQVEEAVFDLMRSEEGYLLFEETPARPARAIEVRLPTDGVLMNAARRHDELLEVTSGAASADPIPRLARPDEGGSTLDLSAFEWEVLSGIDGRRSLRGLARAMARGELEVARAVYSLAAARVVELSSGPAEPESPTTDAEALRSAIAEAIAAGRVDEAGGLLNRLRALEPAAASTYLLDGRIAAMNGEPDRAVRLFDRAIEIDPLLPSPYYHLARAAIGTGELSRARTALETYMRIDDPRPSRPAAAARIAEALARLIAALDEGQGEP